MFFLLSKLLYYLIMPALWLVLLLLLAWRSRVPRRQQRWLRAAAILALVGTNPGLSNEAMRAWEIPPVKLSQLPAQADAAVLLTGVAEDKLPHDRVYLGRGADRLTHTLWLYRAGRVKRILITGGSGSLLETARTEARELDILLRMSGVPKEHILLEENSRNTRENALFTKALLAQYPEIKSLVLVASAFHHRRALGCFQRLGLHPVPFPADYRSERRKPTPDYWIIPSPNALVQWSLLLHEVLGWSMYKVLGYA
ncbi:YdcF family protein [Hymenobacter saemangeumensis]